MTLGELACRVIGVIRLIRNGLRQFLDGLLEAFDVVFSVAGGLGVQQPIWDLAEFGGNFAVGEPPGVVGFEAQIVLPLSGFDELFPESRGFQLPAHGGFDWPPA